MCCYLLRCRVLSSVRSHSTIVPLLTDDVLTNYSILQLTTGLAFNAPTYALQDAALILDNPVLSSTGHGQADASTESSKCCRSLSKCGLCALVERTAPQVTKLITQPTQVSQSSRQRYFSSPRLPTTLLLQLGWCPKLPWMTL